MKKLVCGIFGTIYYATILKDGKMSEKDRVDVTNDAVDAVFQHLFHGNEFQKTGFSGYEIPRRNSDDTVIMCIYDTTKYQLVKKDK